MIHVYTFNYAAQNNTLGFQGPTKVVHIIAEALLAHPNMCHFTLVHIALQNNKCPVNTIPWFTSK
jgi:hypothetical protein